MSPLQLQKSAIPLCYTWSHQIGMSHPCTTLSSHPCKTFDRDVVPWNFVEPFLSPKITDAVILSSSSTSCPSSLVPARLLSATLSWPIKYLLGIKGKVCNSPLGNFVSWFDLQVSELFVKLRFQELPTIPQNATPLLHVTLEPEKTILSSSRNGASAPVITPSA